MNRYRYDRNRFISDAVAPPWPPPPSDVAAFHNSLPGFAETPLIELPALARDLRVGEVWVKDESKRCGLKAFKVLGASYAIHRFMRQRSSGTAITFCSATDGNHGRAVAWSAHRLGHKAVIFVPGTTVSARIDAIRAEGAEVVVVDGSYDDAVRRAAAEAKAHRWQVISDTAYPGYMEIPAWIMEGYATLFEEAARQLAAAGRQPPSVVLLQAGVGGLPCAGTLFFWRRGHRPTLIAVEPIEADCLRESIASANGDVQEATGRQNSIMAGLNCGTPSLLAWPLIRAGMDGFLAIDDDYAREAMRRLASGRGGDPSVIAGESGAAGLGGLLALCHERSLTDARSQLGLEPSARVLLINTEGATDPVSYERIVGRAA